MNIRDNYAYAGNFTAGRQGNPINKIFIHHAATTDFDGIARTFQAVGRGASAHYGVGRNGQVDRYVPEGSIAWHCGNWPYNTTSIGIENVNSGGSAEGWPVAEDTFNTLVDLVRDVASRHGMLPLAVGKNLFGHKDVMATACPGVLYGRLQELADRVNNGSSPAPAPTPGRRTNEQIADAVMLGEFGNNPQRQANLANAGYDYGTIQGIINSRLGIGGAPAPARASVDDIARQVIAGSFGNAPARQGNVERAGYNYGEIQARVNEILGIGGGAAPAPAGIEVGSTVQFTNPIDYTGTRLGVSGNYTVMELRGDRAVVGRGGAVTAAVNVNNLRRV